MNLKVYLADHFDPWFNLATENYLFNDMDPSNNVLFLWRNEKTIVIGRHQNPWTECNVKKMEADGINLVRRQTGGGAVYHDLGNTNFTFLNGRENYSRSANVSIIQNAIGKHGITIEASGRNDLIIPGDEPRKISGSAYRETQDRCFHHGTLLIDADMSKLATYLNPKKKKLESKGIKSVRSRVANLSEFSNGLTHERLVPDIIRSFFDHYGSEAEVETLDHSTLALIPEIQTYYEKLKDWDWRFGKTPEFSHVMDERFAWGDMEVHLNCNKGIINQCVIFSDSLNPALIDAVKTQLTGVAYEASAIAKACENLSEQMSDLVGQIDELKSWLVANIN